MGKNLFDEAIANFSKAIELDPIFAQAYYNRAQIFYTLRALEKCQQNIEDALKNISAPQKADVFLLKAQTAIARNNFWSAIDIKKKQKN